MASEEPTTHDTRLPVHEFRGNGSSVTAYAE